jgi:peptidoglycan/LPS O-acetylase OafA/YrhL
MMKNKAEAIDFLKGYSILTIVLYHIGQIMPLGNLLAKLINFGGTGVHTFIFVSGFGLYLSHLKKPLSFLDFIKKRISKIYTPYIILVVLSALIALVIPVYPNSWYAFFGHVFLYKMFDDSIIGSYGYQLWFISTIIQLYLLFPALTRFKENSHPVVFLLTGLFLSIGWGVLLMLTNHGDIRAWGSFCLQYIWEFMLGMYCAALYFKNGFQFWAISKIYLLILSVAGIGLYGLMALKLGVLGHTFNDMPALFGYTAFSLLLYSFQVPWLNKSILFIAGISYPLYLIHFLVLRLMDVGAKYFQLAFSWPLAVLSILLCLLAAIGFDRLLQLLPGGTKKMSALGK